MLRQPLVPDSGGSRSLGMAPAEADNILEKTVPSPVPTPPRTRWRPLGRVGGREVGPVQRRRPWDVGDVGAHDGEVHRPVHVERRIHDGAETRKCGLTVPGREVDA